MIAWRTPGCRLHGTGALIACGLMLMAGATSWAQAPVNLTENPLRGVIDFHVHSGPDSFTRSVTDLEIARIAKAHGLGAIVLKNHFTMTADRAQLVEREVPGLLCFGGIVLNRAVGGLNDEAIRRMVTFTGQRGKVVWLPTFDAENHVRFFGEQRPSVPVVRDGEPVPELANVFAEVARHDLILATGHSSAEECMTLIRAARQSGVRRILVTHARTDPIGMTVTHLREAAALGAMFECVWASNLQGPDSHLPSNRSWRKVSTADYARAIRSVGSEHFILASDLGQYLNPLPTDGMKAFIFGLRAEGITNVEIDRMARKNPAALLGIRAPAGTLLDSAKTNP